jgi:hypothetical protein
MKLLAGRTQDLADIEAIIESGVDRESLRAAVERAVPGQVATLDRLCANGDRHGDVADATARPRAGYA